MNARLLVTGATGSIGRVLVPALIEAGYAVRGQYVREPGPRGDVEWVRWNLLDDRDPAPLVAGCDAVIHLAAAIHDVAVMDRLNVRATHDLAAAGAGVRAFVHASSIVVYGSPVRAAVDEAVPTIDPAHPIAPQYRAEPYMRDYARTKALAERALHALAPPFRVAIVRPVVVADDAKLLEPLGWGPARRLLFAHRRTNMIHVEDVAAALVHLTRRALADPAPGIETFNVADDAAGTYRDLYARLRGAGLRSAALDRLALPSIVDLAKDAAKHRSLARRYPLGLLRVSTARLRDTGFVPPLGYARAVDRALARRSADQQHQP